MRVLLAILVLLTTLPCDGQVRRRVLGPRPGAGSGGLWPPSTNGLTLWLDVTNVMSYGATNGSLVPLLTNLIRITDTWSDKIGDSNARWLTNQSGSWYFASTASGVTEAESVEQTFTNYISTNAATFAFRLYWVSGDSSPIYPAPVADWVQVQFFSGSVYFDWVSGTQYDRLIGPGVPANQWFNLICVKDSGNQYTYTNGVLGASQASLRVLDPTLVWEMRIRALVASVQFYKRVLVYNRGLSQSEVTNLSNWMTTMP